MELVNIVDSLPLAPDEAAQSGETVRQIARPERSLLLKGIGQSLPGGRIALTTVAPHRCEILHPAISADVGQLDYRTRADMQELACRSRNKH